MSLEDDARGKIGVGNKMFTLSRQAGQAGFRRIFLQVACSCAHSDRGFGATRLGGRDQDASSREMLEDETGSAQKWKSNQD